MGKEWEEGSPGTLYTVTQEDIIECQQFFIHYVSTNNGVVACMPRPDALNFLLPARLQFPSSRQFSRPHQDLTSLVVLALLHQADEYGWATQQDVVRFVEFQFPFYTEDQVLSFILSWVSKDCAERELFDIEGDGAKFRIKPQIFLMLYSTTLHSFPFTGADRRNNAATMRSPELVNTILSLNPPNWRAFYTTGPSPEGTGSRHMMGTPAAAQLPVKQREFSSAGVVGVNGAHPGVFKNIGLIDRIPRTPKSYSAIQSEPVSADPGTVEDFSSLSGKPNLDIHLLIGLSILLSEIKEFHENNTMETEDGYAPNTDKPLNQYLLTKSFPLSGLLECIVAVYKYYSAIDKRKEFLTEFKDRKETIALYFTNHGGKYFVKNSVTGELFQEILLVTALETNTLAPLLLNPEYLILLSGARVPLSDSSLLAMTLLATGDPAARCAVPAMSCVVVFTEQLVKRTMGLSQLEWSPSRITDETVSVFSKLIDHDIFKLENDILTFKDDVDIGQVLEKVTSIVSRLENILKPQIPENILMRFINPKPEPTMDCPPVPRDYLLALALRNLSVEPGAPVPLPAIWTFITHHFPFYRTVPAWSLKELQAGAEFQDTNRFLVHLHAEVHFLSIPADIAEEMYDTVVRFVEENENRIRECMCDPNCLWNMLNGVLPTEPC